MNDQQKVPEGKAILPQPVQERKEARRTIFLVATILAVSAVSAFWIAARPLDRDQVAGTYARVPDLFTPRTVVVPTTITLFADQRIEVLDGEGSILFKGSWVLSIPERTLRIQDPDWDRRIRWIPGWTGAHMFVRTSAQTARGESEEFVKVR